METTDEIEVGDQIDISDFEIEEPNAKCGVTMISYMCKGKRCREPILISFKDLESLLCREGIEPDGGNDGRYHFSKTRVTLGRHFKIAVPENIEFMARRCVVMWSGRSMYNG